MLLAQRPHFEEQVAPRSLPCPPHLLSLVVTIQWVHVDKDMLEKQKVLVKQCVLSGAPDN